MLNLVSLRLPLEVVAVGSSLQKLYMTFIYGLSLGVWISLSDAWRFFGCHQRWKAYYALVELFCEETKVYFCQLIMLSWINFIIAWNSCSNSGLLQMLILFLPGAGCWQMDILHGLVKHSQSSMATALLEHQLWFGTPPEWLFLVFELARIVTELLYAGAGGCYW